MSNVVVDIRANKKEWMVVRTTCKECGYDGLAVVHMNKQEDTECRRCGDMSSDVTYCYIRLLENT